MAASLAEASWLSDGNESDDTSGTSIFGSENDDVSNFGIEKSASSADGLSIAGGVTARAGSSKGCRGAAARSAANTARAKGEDAPMGNFMGQTTM
jgi:hypothetical protein